MGWTVRLARREREHALWVDYRFRAGRNEIHPAPIDSFAQLVERNVDPKHHLQQGVTPVWAAYEMNVS
jgi:hypothetical protein